MGKDHSRREFIASTGALAVALVPALGIANAQDTTTNNPPRPKPDSGGPSMRTNTNGPNSGQGGTFPPINPRRDPSSIDDNAPNVDRKEVLKANDKDIKSNVLRLAELADDLKKEVEKTDSANVLSLPMVHKAEEIERLAKHIAMLARG